MKKMNNKGFTIVELVIVIAVIAILAAVMIPTFSGIVDKANNSALEQKVAAAYKEAMAEELADDGIYNGSAYDVKTEADGTTTKLGYITVNEIQFTWVADADSKFTGDADAAWTEKGTAKTADIVDGKVTIN